MIEGPPHNNLSSVASITSLRPKGLHPQFLFELSAARSDAKLNSKSFQDINKGSVKTLANIAKSLQRTQRIFAISQMALSESSLASGSERTSSMQLSGNYSSTSLQSLANIRPLEKSEIATAETRRSPLAESPKTDEDLLFEEERLKALRDYQIIDFDEIHDFDNLTKLGALATDSPICLISLVDHDAARYISRHGTDMRQIERADSFCSHLITYHDESSILVVEDASKDERFCSLPIVTGAPHIRFYAGIPLISANGYPIGTLCIMDTVAGQLSEKRRVILQDLAAQVQIELENLSRTAKLEYQIQETEGLLQNILPVDIIERLKSFDIETSDELVLADEFSSATVIFIDIVGFTKYAGKVTASELVQRLGTLFSRFDRLTLKHDITKIKTIGDGYLAVGGVPKRSENHAENVVAFALDLLQVVEEFNVEYHENFNIRMGINTGPVTAGVVGTEKFTYDIFGNAVNIASRLESHGAAGKIHISESTHQLIKDKFSCDKLPEPIYIKGKDEKIQTYFVRE